MKFFEQNPLALCSAFEKQIKSHLDSTFQIARQFTQPGHIKFRPGVDLAQHDLRCQQFQANIRISDSAPTLVGGATFPSTSGKDQTYLIIEAIVNRE